ncbi:hypothetical protein BASA50_010771 [Batrachochytrium salamandrivorans]|uniref:Histone H2A/H2B/H3 domain-containing protein n=1 Tax=Batrachochytrium salamandrivorans TaxID=1357716 RepID=A0ABQ8EXI0_9FUNG|nr:hypothetical protein BASA60_005613 [Batrachochytrium salamandrivorans]KAH6588369.1 hypothetical protein BASA50_010771 [Batrachochytrium salamandrivorans]
MRDYLDDDDDDSNDSDKSETSKNETCKSIHTAMGMVKWTMTHNVWLSTTFKIECILGWGGCGVVLGATRRSNNKEISTQRPSMLEKFRKKQKSGPGAKESISRTIQKKGSTLPKTQERHSQTTVTELRKYQNSLAKYVLFRYRQYE